MIDFKKLGDCLFLRYSFTGDQENWIKKKLKEEEEITLKMTFSFELSDLIKETNSELNLDPFSSEEPALLLLGKLEGQYYKVKKGVLVNDFDIFIYKKLKLKQGYFIADSNASIFRAISKVSKNDFYLGGDHETAIPVTEFERLIKSFPGPYERKKYIEARISGILTNYIDNVKDAQKSFENYLNKKESRQGENLIKTFKSVDLYKYQMLHGKLVSMLKTENQYNEKQWQEEILQIILLLYPKYIQVFKEVPIKATLASGVKNKFLDFLLIDINGNVDIIEIKKPFERAIMTTGQHRDNHIPLRELSGTIMQIEKYIYYLNRWGFNGEKFLRDKFKDSLPVDFDIKITNPSGIIIMGRDNNLSENQKRDFEVVKRKYKNVADIITYDNLLDRLKFIIEQIKKL